MDLNTTFVSLQPFDSNNNVKSFILFKYNFCFSSTKLEVMIPKAAANLNTTFVSLQQSIPNFAALILAI